MTACKHFSAACLAKLRLNIEDTVSPVLFLALGCHGPEELNAMPGHGNIGVITSRHQDGVALPHHGNELGALGIGVKLSAFL